MTAQIISQLLASEPQRDLLEERKELQSTALRIFDLLGRILLAPLWGLSLLGWLIRKIGPGIHVVAAFTHLISSILDFPYAVAGVVWNWLVLFFSFRWVTRGGLAVSLLLEPILGVVFAAVAPIAWVFKGIDDAVHRPRALRDNERALLLRLFPERFVSKLVIHPEDSWMRKLSAHGGFTIAESIYLPEARNQWQAHEALHTLQYWQTPGGAAAFLGRYFGQYLGYRITGNDHNAAYHKLDAEHEAHALFSPPG